MQYAASIRHVAVLRLLAQLGGVYATMRIPALEKMVPFMPFGEVETVIVDAVKFRYLQARDITTHYLCHP